MNDKELCQMFGTTTEDVDADVERAHPIPSLRKRASLCAAQATVQVRWNGGRGPLLTHGLDVPEGGRSLVRHRNRNNIRSQWS